MRNKMFLGLTISSSQITGRNPHPRP